MLYLSNKRPKLSNAYLIALTADQLKTKRAISDKSKFGYSEMIKTADLTKEIIAYRVDLFSHVELYQTIFPENKDKLLGTRHVVKICGYWFRRSLVDMIKTKSGKAQILIYPQNKPLLVVSDKEKENYIFVCGLNVKN